MPHRLPQIKQTLNATNRKQTWPGLLRHTVLVAVILFLLLLNVPGYNDNQGILTAYPLIYEHGWPAVWLFRLTPPNMDRQSLPSLQNALPDASVSWNSLPSTKLADEVSFAQGEPLWQDSANWPIHGFWQVSWTGVLFNMSVAVLVISLTCILVRDFPRTSLKRLTCVSTVAILVCYWSYRSPERRSGEVIQQKVNRSIAPTWLRMVVGANNLPSYRTWL